MKGKKSRFARIWVLALALSVTVGVVSGSVADAKKKGKKKGGNTVTVSTTGPATVPPSTLQPPGCSPFGGGTPCTAPEKQSLVTVPLTVGKKAKGTVVGADSVRITFTLTGDPRVPGTPGPGPGPFPVGEVPAGTSSLALSLTAPNGRTISLETPGDPNATTVGPVTETANSPISFCTQNFVIPTPATTTCAIEDPEGTVVPPTWAGTIGNPELSDFAGISARGTWAMKVRNLSTQSTGVLSSASLQIPLQAASASGGGGKKK